ncbi:MAG TPA: NAD(P)-dependent alcohol dehydrogenase [Actinomycetota bacterium]|nr:NAD(P)-dependent alcohol dehydrogenase [Actinomycetota bacterium]
MRAVFFDRYGPPEVLRIEDVPKPTPRARDLLVRVHASSVTRTDTGARTAEYAVARLATGLVRPRHKPLGWEFAGEVEAMGADVEGFAVGDRVFGLAAGSNADYVRVRATGPVAHMPPSMPIEEAAAVPDGACTARSLLQQAGAREGQTILIYGASGSIGTAAVQLAKQLGATVVAVCDTAKLEVVRSLGPDAVIDYTKESFLQSGERHDVILDAVGKLAASEARRSLAPGGVYLTAGSPGSLGGVLARMLFTNWASKTKVKLGVARYKKEDVLFVKQLIEAGDYRPVIDRTYALEDIVEAHRYVDTEQKTGNVVLTLAG